MGLSGGKSPGTAKEETMTTTATETGTFVAEYSYEATTLDYLHPRWYTFAETEGSTKEQAEAFVAAKYAEQQKTFEEQGSVEPVAYRVTRVAPQAEVDEMLEAEFEANRRYWADRAAEARRMEEAKERMFATYGRGSTVRVVKGRKVPVGTEGTVFWLGEDRFSRVGAYRVGFETAEGEKHFTALSNVEAVEA